MCAEIRLTLAEVRRRTPSAVPAWGPRGTTPRLTVRGTAAGAPPPPPPPPPIWRDQHSIGNQPLLWNSHSGRTDTPVGPRWRDHRFGGTTTAVGPPLWWKHLSGEISGLVGPDCWFAILAGLPWRGGLVGVVVVIEWWCWRSGGPATVVVLPNWWSHRIYCPRQKWRWHQRADHYCGRTTTPVGLPRQRVHRAGRITSLAAPPLRGPGALPPWSHHYYGGTTNPVGFLWFDNHAGLH